MNDHTHGGQLGEGMGLVHCLVLCGTTPPQKKPPLYWFQDNLVYLQFNKYLVKAWCFPGTAADSPANKIRPLRIFQSGGELVCYMLTWGHRFLEHVGLK